MPLLDTLTTRSLLPVIRLPSQITSSSATLTDNIITNNVAAVSQSVSFNLSDFTILDLNRSNIRFRNN